MKISSLKENRTTLVPKLKSYIIIYLANAVLLLPLMCFAFPHYTSDSYLLAFHYDWHVNAFLGAYRYVGALFIRLWTSFADPIADPFWDMVVFILFSALAITVLSFLFFGELQQRSKLLFAVTDLAVVISVANFFLCNILTFPESIFPVACGVLLCFLGVFVYFHSSLCALLRYPLAGLLLICCTAVYQQFLTMFIIFSILMLVLRAVNKDQTSTKEVFFGYLRFVLFTGLCTVTYYIIGIGLQNVLQIESNPRAAFSMQSILDGIKYYLTHQRGILNGKYQLRTNLLRRCFESLVLLWGISGIVYLRKNRLSLKTALVFLAFPVGYASVYLVGVISEHDGVRVIMGLFSIFALFGISALALSRSRKLACVMLALFLFVFCLNTYKNIQVFYNLTAVNTQEISLTRLYLYEIDRYESETGNTVNTIVFGADPNPGPFAENAFAADWGVAGIFEFVSGGRIFQAQKITEDAHTKYFRNKDWKDFVPDEQLVFEDDTLYLCIW